MPLRIKYESLVFYTLAFYDLLNFKLCDSLIHLARLHIHMYVVSVRSHFQN